MRRHDAERRRTSRRRRPGGVRAAARIGAFALLAGLAACGGRKQGELPSLTAARAAYAQSTGVDSVRLNGNVLEYWIRQPPEQLRRGGSLWARVGPYIYLFTPATRQLFDRYDGLAGVRIITQGPGGKTVAQALLPRDTMSDVKWRRSLNILGHALQEGTKQPTRLEDLIDWGERNTRFEYNPEFLPK